MPKTHRKRVLCLCLLLLSTLQWGRGQDNQAPTKISLISYIQQLENNYDIKFSYVDADISTFQINPLTNGGLQDNLDHIRRMTQLVIDPLDNRYYTITKTAMVDLCAIVLDNFEENTVTGASIEVLGTDKGTITDSNGQFTLKNIPRSASVSIRHIGFKTRFVTAEQLVQKNPCTTILLAVNYQQLEEVVVFKFLTTGISKQFNANIEIDMGEFGILPGLIEPDVLQTVQALPGIKSIDERVSDINIRGGTNDQNLILWDGIKMYQSGHFFGLISAFNPFLTEKVTVIKNGTSAKYGDGVSGIINMETKDSIDEQYFGGAGLNLISGDLYGHVPINEKLALQFSARRALTDFLNTPTYDQFSDRAFQDTEVKNNSNQPSQRAMDQNEDFYFYDFTGKVLYDINDRQKLRLSAIHINNNLDYSETAEDSGGMNRSSLDQTNISFGGSLQSDWTKKFSTNLSAYYTRYNLDAENIVNDGAQRLLQNNLVLESSAKLNTSYAFSEKLSWHNGYQLSEVGIANVTFSSQPPFLQNIKGVVRAHALFSELDYESADKKFKAKVGGRFNHIENLDTFTEFIAEPRLNLNYTFARNFRVEVLGEFKHQVTNQRIDLEQNFLGIEKRRWILSDSPSGTEDLGSLPVTRSKQFSVGINYDRDNWYVGIEGFLKEVDGISTTTQGFQNEDQFNGEIGKYNNKGIEFLINHKNDAFSTWLGYTYNLNDYTFEDIVPSRFPNNLDTRHTITLASTYAYQNLKLGIGINYRSGKPFTEPLESDPIDTTFFPSSINYSEPNSSRLPDYIRADASAIYDFNLNSVVRASAGISVLNLLDRRNILNTYYRLNDQDEIETVESFSLGLTPNVSFRVSF